MELAEIPLHTWVALLAIGILTVSFHQKFDEKTLAYGPTILTTTGIFATFFGIAVGLMNFKVTDLQGSVPALLEGLRTAFMASVLGVGGALSLKLRHFYRGRSDAEGSGADGEVTAADLANQLRAIQQALVGSDDSTIVSQLKLSRQDVNDRLDALKRAQLEALQELSKMGSAQLVEALKNVIADFNKNLTEQFGENFKQLNEAVAQLVVWQQQYKEHVEATSAINKQTANTMQEAAASYTTLVSRADTFVQVSEALAKLLDAFEVQKEQLNSALTSLAGLLNTASAGLPQIERRVDDLTSQLVRSVSSNQEEVSRALTENAEALRKSATEVSKLLRESAENNQKEVGEAIAKNSQLVRTSLQSVVGDFGKINEEFRKMLEESAKNTKEKVTALDVALQEELEKSLNSLGQQLTALSQKFIEDYGPLTDKLQKLVQSSRV